MKFVIPFLFVFILSSNFVFCQTSNIRLNQLDADNNKSPISSFRDSATRNGLKIDGKKLFYDSLHQGLAATNPLAGVGNIKTNKFEKGGIAGVQYSSTSVFTTMPKSKEDFVPRTAYLVLLTWCHSSTRRIDIQIYQAIPIPHIIDPAQLM